MKTSTSSKAAALLLAAAAAVTAANGPVPPCVGDASPAYAAAGAPPATAVWRNLDWTPPPCLGWKPAEGALVATAGRFPVRGADFRRRLGAISGMKGLRYWSATDGRWEPLIVDAAALAGPDGPRRADFSPAELKPGRVLWFEQADNRYGSMRYRLRVIEASDDRLVFATENAAPARLLGLTIAEPGELQSVTFVEREGDEWRYYALSRMGKAASLLTGGHDASLINRAVALFRYFAE